MGAGQGESLSWWVPPAPASPISSSPSATPPSRPAKGALLHRRRSRRDPLSRLADNSVGRMIEQILRADLVLIDEIGFAPLEHTGAQLFFRLVAAAYERRSLGIASHWPFEDWGRFLPEQTTAVSLLDRLLHHPMLVVTDGESFRMKEARKGGKPRLTETENTPRGVGTSGGQNRVLQIGHGHRCHCEAREVLGKSGNPFLAAIGLRVEPGPWGSGIRVDLGHQGGVDTSYVFRSVESFHDSLRSTVHDSLRQGLYGSQVVDCVVTLVECGYTAPGTKASASAIRRRWFCLRIPFVSRPLF